MDLNVDNYIYDYPNSSNLFYGVTKLHVLYPYFERTNSCSALTENVTYMTTMLMLIGKVLTRFGNFCVKMATLTISMLSSKCRTGKYEPPMFVQRMVAANPPLESVNSMTLGSECYVVFGLQRH